MDKIILVYYIGVKTVTPKDINLYLHNIKDLIFIDDENVIRYIIPVMNTNETRIECLNPKIVSKKDYTHTKKIIENNQKIVDKLVNDFKK